MNIGECREKFIEIFGEYEQSLHDDIYPRYYQAFLPNESRSIHFELTESTQDGPICLGFHIERSHYWEFDSIVKKYKALFNKPENYRDCDFYTSHSSLFWKMRRPITSLANFEEDAKRLEQMIRSAYEQNNNNTFCLAVPAAGTRQDSVARRGVVELESKNLHDLLDMPLNIPEYQRIYCWEEKNVYRLLDDILDLSAKKEYYLGNIILQEIKQETNKKYDVIDGQQRLVTLSLILMELGKNDVSLLRQAFSSDDANTYVAYNRYIIQQYLTKFSDENKREFIDSLQKLLFSVLILQDSSIDLAYTFFSTQNSRGKALTDYELLKSHHLRYIQSEKQAEHLATRWDGMLLEYENKDDETERAVSRTLGMYLYRLRKWMRKNTWIEEEKYRVKTEFEAAIVIPSIPPFGERFEFNEAIQGGSHFFAFVDRFVDRFNKFKQRPEYRATEIMTGESHWWYRDVFQTFLFAYYIKFGNSYLADALFCIAKLISQHRFENGRSNFHKLLEYSGDSEIVMMIDRATSPTFFLGEALNKIQHFAAPTELSGIRSRFNKLLIKMFRGDNLHDGTEPIMLEYSVEKIKQMVLGKE